MEFYETVSLKTNAPLTGEWEGEPLTEYRHTLIPDHVRAFLHFGHMENGRFNAEFAMKLPYAEENYDAIAQNTIALLNDARRNKG